MRTDGRLAPRSVVRRTRARGERRSARSVTARDAVALGRVTSSGVADATFFHRIGWRDDPRGGVPAPHRTYLLAERGGAIVGVLPLAEVSSRLFGHSLVSLPFCVYGGPAADDAETGDALARCGGERWAATLASSTSSCATARRCGADWAQQDLYVTFRKALLPEREANLACRSRASSVRWSARDREAGPGERRSTRDARPLLRAARRQRASSRNAAVLARLFRAAAATCSATTAKS